MKKLLVLLAGYPGTGKSFLSDKIRRKYPCFTVLSPDEIKEEYWDRFGFENLDEKEQLIRQSWDAYYRRMEEAFQQETALISDYPFSVKQHDRIQGLCHKYGYAVLTIRLVGDLETLFERQKRRDLDLSRHLGHIAMRYKKSDPPIPHEQADNLLNHEEFIHRCKTRGYGEFALGTTVEIDVTDFNTADYDQAFNALARMYQKSG